jgi:hypothetical protein
MEGGQWPTHKTNRKGDRLGTAETGHLRKYLVTEVIHQRDQPHYFKEFAKGFEENPRLYNMHKHPETAPFVEANPKTLALLRPNFETMKRENQKLVDSFKN